MYTYLTIGPLSADDILIYASYFRHFIVLILTINVLHTASPASLVFSSFSPSLTTSEDEADEAELKRMAGRARWGRLGAVKEDRSSQEDDDDGEDGEDESRGARKWSKEETTRNEKDGRGKPHENGIQDGRKVSGMRHKEAEDNRDGRKIGSEGGKVRVGIDSDGGKGRITNDGGILRLGCDSDGGSSEDSEGGPWRYKEFGKDYEPLKSVQLLRNLEKSLSTYLPAHSLASDTEAGEP